MNRPRTIPMPAPSIESMKAAVDAKLDPALLEEAAIMNSKERISAAEKLRRWSDQLIASARELEPLEKLTMPGNAAN